MQIGKVGVRIRLNKAPGKARSKIGEKKVRRLQSLARGMTEETIGTVSTVGNRRMAAARAMVLHGKQV